MKKYLIVSILSLLSFQEILANHTKGGWMYYEYLGHGIIDPAKLRYKIGLNLYIDCSSILIEPTWNFSFFNGAAPYTFIQDIAVNAAPDYSINGCTSTVTCYPCLDVVPVRCYKIINYETVVELAPSAEGYIISKQRCCRVMGIINIPNSSGFGETFTIKIPGLNNGPTASMNTSPVFIFKDTAVVCANNPFALNFTATDADADSLSYSFVAAYDGSNNASPGWPNTTTADPPPYNNVLYNLPYSGTQPLGISVTIDPVTGLISGTAPPTGEYVICVLVKEYRNGLYIAESRKELHLRTAPCIPLIASSNFNSITCDGFTVDFQDNSNGNPTSYLWNFGDPASGAANTSTLQNPSHTYSDTGIYLVKLKISINGQCSDSITRPLAVYPGFLPGFITSPTLCVGAPIQFTDTTYSRYAPVNSWRWDFGDLSTLADTSHLQNPLYTYNAAGIYTIQLIVTNTKGCRDTLYRDIEINVNPLVTLFPRDTTYCGLDSLQLTATGTGIFSWVPLTNITGGNTATPLVFPTVPTRYIVTLTSPAGCKSRDSLTITPLNDLTNAIAANPPVICEEDTLTLTGTSNHSSNISWQWTPVATLGTPTQAITTAYPIVNTTYTLTTRWGNNCVAIATKNITVKALANPNAGPDAFVCSGGQSTTQLNASGGNVYQWTPVTGLNNPNIANPVASPTVPTLYVVAVGANGCPKLRTDTVFVDVGTLPLLTAMNDTLICNIDTIAITTTGTGNFVWSPNYNISSTTAANPLVSPDVPTWYHVRLTDAVGCHSDDSVFIDVKDHVTLLPLRDTSICKTDSLHINTVSDGLHFLWSPNVEIFTATSMRPVILPTQSRVYTVIANIGKCSDTKSISIKVVPYPAADAGPDAFVCTGFSTQLNASGGSNYVWNPVTFLNNRFIPDPISKKPTASIRYIVTVTDTLGCPKAVKDTVWVNVYPKVLIGARPRDTSVVEGEPLFISVSTGNTYSYLWTPSQWLNNPNIGNPIALPKDNIRYVVQATSPAGCKSLDTVNVRLYKVDPDMYVPTAFSPNGDGENDIFRPILLGMKELTYFKVYNRFGQLLYSTSEIGKGWDGTFAGKGQDPATYVWMAVGVTYKGEVKKKKGYVVLIR